MSQSPTGNFKLHSNLLCILEKISQQYIKLWVGAIVPLAIAPHLDATVLYDDEHAEI